VSKKPESEQPMDLTEESVGDTDSVSSEDLVNLLTLACSFRSQAQFFKLINFQYSYPVPCPFRTFLINKLH